MPASSTSSTFTWIATTTAAVSGCFYSYCCFGCLWLGNVAVVVVGYRGSIAERNTPREKRSVPRSVQTPSVYGSVRGGDPPRRENRLRTPLTHRTNSITEPTDGKYRKNFEKFTEPLAEHCQACTVRVRTSSQEPGNGTSRTKPARGSVGDDSQQHSTLDTQQHARALTNTPTQNRHRTHTSEPTSHAHNHPIQRKKQQFLPETAHEYIARAQQEKYFSLFIMYSHETNTQKVERKHPPFRAHTAYSVFQRARD